jgi:phage protein D
MPAAEYRVFLDNQSADESRLAGFSQVRVDQAIGMATEAELHMDICLDDKGNWSGIEEAFAQPFKRVRVEVKLGEEAFVPLVDGPIVAQRFELSALPDASKLILVVHDDSVLLNQVEEVAVFDGETADGIATQLFRDHQLDTEVDSVAPSGGTLSRFVVQRGTAMQLLRELARRHGMFVYVKPGPNPGKSVGVFVKPDLTDSGLPELLIAGKERNVDRFDIQLDALRPVSARAQSIDIAAVQSLSSEAHASTLTALGDKPVHEVVTPGHVLLARTREDSSDLDDATNAAVDHSSWAFTASGEVVVGSYAGVLTPHRVVKVAGPGGYLGGAYLISQVTHVLTDGGYRQQFVLRRNARSDEGADGGPIPGGVF